MAATVRIWWFLNGNTFARSMGLGHGSLELPPFQHGMENVGSQYITWAPDRNAPIRANAAYSLHEDTQLYGGAFETFEIPTISRTNRCGLQPSPITAWWREVSHHNSPRPYRLLSSEYNCDGTVVEALKRGGAELYAPCPFAMFLGAATLKQWLVAIETNITRMNTTLNRAATVLDAALRGDWTRVPDAVWTFAEWKTRSAVSMGRRKEQVATIDTLLPRYNPNGDERARFALLNAILVQAVDHLHKKPQSDRRAAVGQLGAQVFTRINRILNPAA